MTTFDEYPELPDFLNRKLTGIVSASGAPSANVRPRDKKLTWPKKRNWRKIVERRRAQERLNGTALSGGLIIARKGQ